MTELTVALITALVSVVSVTFAIWRVKQQRPSEILDTEIKLRGIIDDLGLKLDDCQKEKENLKIENFKLYQKLSESGLL